jgi:hypothetical protein
MKNCPVTLKGRGSRYALFHKRVKLMLEPDNVKTTDLKYKLL